jgi:hypothetical protein
MYVIGVLAEFPYKVVIEARCIGISNHNHSINQHTKLEFDKISH